MAKVLLVEDDNNLREIYEARMQAEGYEIITAKDGEEALVVAKANTPDLVISDVMMPKISGFEMLDILRNTQGLKDVKVIMLTALGQSDDQQRADKLGADRYLVKSQVTLEDIVTAAHELLEGEAAAIEAAVPSEPNPAAPIASPAPVAVAPEPVVIAEPVAVDPVPVAVVTEPSVPVPAPPVVAPIPQLAATPPVAPTPSVAPTPEPAPTPIIAPVPDSASDSTAQTTAQEEAAVEAQIEDFVAGAPAQAPVEPTVAPIPQLAAPPPVAPTPAAAPTPSVAPTPEPAPTPVVQPLQPTALPDTETQVDTGSVPIANKKVIAPAANTAPDINQLLAQEEAKQIAAQPAPAAPTVPPAAPATVVTPGSTTVTPTVPPASGSETSEDINNIAL